MNVILMRGISGSGKTTEAKRLATLSPGTVIVSTDHYLFAGGQEFHFSRLERCHEQCQKDFEFALKDLAPLIIVDNTNTKFSNMVPYIELIEKHQADFMVMQIHVSPKVALERTTHTVPIETLQRQAARIWSERLPDSWNVWNKGIPWRPQAMKPRVQPEFRHSWTKPHPMGEQCSKCGIVRVANSRERKVRAGAKVVREPLSYSYYKASGGVLSEGKLPECTQ